MILYINTYIILCTSTILARIMRKNSEYGFSTKTPGYYTIYIIDFIIGIIGGIRQLRVGLFAN